MQILKIKRLNYYHFQHYPHHQMNHCMKKKFYYMLKPMQIKQLQNGTLVFQINALPQQKTLIC